MRIEIYQDIYSKGFADVKVYACGRSTRSFKAGNHNDRWQEKTNREGFYVNDGQENHICCAAAVYVLRHVTHRPCGHLKCD